MNRQRTAFETALRRSGKPVDMSQLNRTCAWRKQIAEEQRRLSEQLRASRTEVSTCPVCGSSILRLFVTIYEYPYSECGECGHIFSQTPPSDEALAALYSDQAGEHSAQGMIYIDEELYERRIGQIAEPKVEFCSEVIAAEGLWVDVGCGTGELLAAASKKGWDVRGIETDPAEIEFGRGKGLDIRRADVHSLEADDLADARVLSLLNLLEHLKDQSSILCELVSFLKKGSHVVLEVPRHPSLSSFVNLAFPHLAYRHIYAPDHLHVFTERSMEVMLERAGLKVVAVWTFGQDFQDMVFGAAMNAGLEECDFLSSIVNLSASVQQDVDEAGLSDVLFVVAEKS